MTTTSAISLTSTTTALHGDFSTKVVQIPTTIGWTVPKYKGARYIGTGPYPGPEADASAARGAALDYRKAKGISADSRHILNELWEGGVVTLAALESALVESLAANSTRFGQSAQRSAHRDLLLAAWTWLRDGAPLPAQPVSYTTGATVTVTVNPDGTVEIDVDLSEVTDKHAFEAASFGTDDQMRSDAEVEAIFAQVDAALEADRVTVTA
jgi:hypothetical protein